MNPVHDGPGASGQVDSTERILVVFDQATVDLDALQRSAYAVAAQMTVDIRVSGSSFSCTLFPRAQAFTADELRHRFRTEVNDQVLRARIARETEPLRNLVFALAFSQTGLADSDDDGGTGAGA